MRGKQAASKEEISTVVTWLSGVGAALINQLGGGSTENVLLSGKAGSADNPGLCFPCLLALEHLNCVQVLLRAPVGEGMQEQYGFIEHQPCELNHICKGLKGGLLH